MKKRITAGASLAAEEGNSSYQPEEPLYYINILNINTGKLINYFPVYRESWEDTKIDLQRQGYSELYDFDDDKDGDINIFEYDDEGFYQKYGSYGEINLYFKKTLEPTKTPKKEQRMLDFIQFAREQLSSNIDGQFEEIDEETIRTLKISHHAIDRGSERAKGTLDLIKDLNNLKSLKLGVKGKYMTKEGIEENRYYMITQQAVYVLNEEKTTVITTWGTSLSFNDWLNRKKLRKSSKK